MLARQMAQLSAPEATPDRPWAEELVRLGRLTALDRATLAQTVGEIRVFEGNRIEIDYLFSKELRTLLEDGGQAEP
jgi:endonuclease/exonuclease/phosphatase (EEP) superfamily protein YafD